jgi:hypothetical protein
LVFPCLGHLFVGDVKRGVAFVVGGVINVLLIFGYIGFLTLPIWRILGAVDASRGARNYNAGLPDRPPLLTLRAWALIHTISFLSWTVLLLIGLHPRAAQWLVWGAFTLTTVGFLIGF